MQTKHEKKVAMIFSKGREVRIKTGEHEGQFGTIKKVTDDEGKRFLRIKLDRMNKTVEHTTEEVKLIPEAKLNQEFETIGDIEDDEDFILVQGEDEVSETKEFIADKDKEEYDGLFVKIENGEIVQAYGFNGTPTLDNGLTRLETAEEHLKRVIV